MTEKRTRSNIICDNILEIANAIKDCANKQDCEDDLKLIAANIGDCTLIETKDLAHDLKLMAAILWKMNHSEACNGVTEGYAIVLRDMLEQFAQKLEIDVFDKNGKPLEDDGK